MKNVLITICLVCVVMLSGMISGCVDKSYSIQIPAESSQERLISDPELKNLVCSGGRWVDKKTYVFDSEIVILSFVDSIKESRFLRDRVDVTIMNIQVGLGGNATAFVQIELTPRETELYKNYKMDKKYPVTVKIVKGGYLDRGSWTSYKINNNYPISKFVIKDSALEFIDNVEKVKK